MLVVYVSSQQQLCAMGGGVFPCSIYCERNMTHAAHGNFSPMLPPAMGGGLSGVHEQCCR